MKTLALLLLFIGIICMTIGYTYMENKCTAPKIVYRYLPDNAILNTQMSPTHISDTFKTMFENGNPDVRDSPY